MKPSFKITVVDCPRCHKRHDGMTFKAFQEPMEDGHTHFGTCPNKKEPVLFEMKTESRTDYFDGTINFKEPTYA